MVRGVEQKYRNDGSQGAEKLPDTDANGNPITYTESDVEPKQPGVGRTDERIVRGSDGSDYYTSDHYKHFDKVP